MSRDVVPGEREGDREAQLWAAFARVRAAFSAVPPSERLRVWNRTSSDRRELVRKCCARYDVDVRELLAR